MTRRGNMEETGKWWMMFLKYCHSHWPPKFGALWNTATFDKIRWAPVQMAETLLATCSPYTKSIEIPIPDFVKESWVALKAVSDQSLISQWRPTSHWLDFCWNFQEVRHLHDTSFMVHFPAMFDQSVLNKLKANQLADTLALETMVPIDQDFGPFTAHRRFGGSQCWGHPSTGSGGRCPMVSK